MRTRRWAWSLLVSFIVSGSLLAADWPQFRHDAGRSAASDEQLAAKLVVRWERQLPRPQPAFPREIRLRFDATYQPVVAGKTIFVPSMVTDSVVALDSETGRQRWRFFADGPVRFAPVAWQGRIYFVSDDGHLYCLEAADGSLCWKVRGLPAGRPQRRLMGDGRLISLWPARGGPVLADGVLYFAAGIWPATGVFIHAVDARTGKLLWSNVGSNHIEKANMDHCVAHYAGLTPQGYLAVAGDRLIVPCGAQLPAFLDRKTGKLHQYTMGWGGRIGLPKGSWFVAAAGHYLVNSGDLYDITRPNDERFRDPRMPAERKRMLYPGAVTRLQIERTNQKGLGQFRQPVLTEKIMYYDDVDGIVACDLSRATVEQRKPENTPEYRREDTYPDRLQASFPELWRLKTKLRAFIKAGSRLYAGGPGVVAAIKEPSAGQSPTVDWQARIQGTPAAMLAADGKLFVVTRQGRLYAFGPDAGQRAAVHGLPQPGSPKQPADAWTNRAQHILQAAGVRDGYALVLGLQAGRLVEELVRQSKLYVIAIDPDAERVAKLREQLQRVGWYGTRATAHVGSPADYALPPFLASLVTTEEPARLSGAPDAALARRLYRLLRPYGGTACLPVDGGQTARWAKALSGAKAGPAHLRQAGELVLLSRPGPLPGAADWSHDQADAGNTGGTPDRYLKPPLALLWFNGSTRWDRTPGATAVRVAGGGVFILTSKLWAFDAFTGRHLWESAVPSPAPRRRAELVALPDAIYLAAGKQCLELDPTTGEQRHSIPLPPKMRGPWTNLHVSGNHLVATSGKTLFCLDRQTGKLLWRYAALYGQLRLAVGGGKVFCAELVQKRKGQSPAQQARTVALALETGDVLWQVPGGAQLRYSQPLDLLVTATGAVYRGQDGSRLRPAGPAGPIVGDRIFAGEPDNVVVYAVKTGAKVGRELKWMRRGCTALRCSLNLLTTRWRGNSAYIDLATGKPTPVWGVRAACSNNLFPADGLLNAPNLTGGCTCNYLPTSFALAPASEIVPARP